MPAQAHSRKANTKKKQDQWAHVRASEIARGKSPGQADRIANGVTKKQTAKNAAKRAK